MLKKTINRIALAGLGLALGISTSALANTTGKVFVAGDGSGNIAVIDAHTNTVTTTIDTGAGTAPHNFVVGPNSQYVWAALKGSGEVIKIDAVTNTEVARFSTGTGTPNPVHLDISADGNSLYVVNKADKTLVMLDTTSGAIINTYSFAPAVDYNPHDINISPDGNSIWITDEYNNSVMVLDTGLAGVTSSIGVGARPIQVTFSVDGSEAFVTNFNDIQSGGDPNKKGTVSVIDVATQTVTDTFDMGGTGGMGPMGAVVSPDGSKLWLTGTAGNAVHGHSLLAGDNYSYTDTSGLLQAHGLDISDDGGFLYTSVKNGALSANRDAVAVIDASTGLLVTTIQTTGLTGIADATALHGLVYVSAVPVPAAVWLFGSGLLALIGVARRKKAA